MKIIKNLLLIFVFSLIITLPVQNIFAGLAEGPITFSDTDTNLLIAPQFNGLVYFFDLRDRESYIQLTYEDTLGLGVGAEAHVQIFNVAQNCNENDFFDSYTINDTHVYNMRNILTNDGDPSGVELPDNAYGIVVISVNPDGNPTAPAGSFGNMRIIDDNGYEYRTNAQKFYSFATDTTPPFFIYSFNYNNEAGVTLSDVVGINLLSLRAPEELPSIIEWDAQDVANIYTAYDVDIYDENEVPFSCRNVIFSCVNKDNPRIEELLENAQVASIASFEYGINEVIPHSKGGELLCPSNNISNGIVNLSPLQFSINSLTINSSRGTFFPFPLFFGYIGLNNGNGRGSFDSISTTNLFTPLNNGGG